MIYNHQAEIAKEAVAAYGEDIIEATTRNLCETVANVVAINAETFTEEDITRNTYRIKTRVFIAPPNFAEKIVEQFEQECTGECAVCGFSNRGTPCRLIRQLLTGERGADNDD